MLRRPVCKRAICAYLMLSLFFWQAPVFSAVDEGDPSEVVERLSDFGYAPGEIIVQLKKGASISDLQGLNRQFKVAEVREIFSKRPSARETLDTLRKKRAALEAEQHPEWDWWGNPDSSEFKAYQRRLANEKEELDQQILAQEELTARLERKQQQASNDLDSSDRVEDTYLLTTDEDADVPSLVKAYQGHPAVEYAEPNYR